MYAFKKLITPFLMPFPIAVVVAVLGLLLLWFTRRQKLGRGLVTVGFASAMLLAYAPVATPLLSWLEHDYPALLNPGAVSANAQTAGRPLRFIVVLGGGHHVDPDLPVTHHLGQGAQDRVLEAVRLHRALPDTKLLFSGGYPMRGVSHAEAMARVAEVMGVPRSVMVLEEQSIDTETETDAVRGFVQNHRFILVTSASHMRRAMGLFKGAGFDPVAAPCGFTTKASLRLRLMDFVFPHPANILATETVARESLGYLWSRLRGRI